MTTADPVSDEQRPPHLNHAWWSIPGRAVVAAALVMGLVALERQWHLGYSLGVFYVFPVILAATVLPRGRAVLFALACVWARSWFVPDTSVIEYWLRALMALLAYGGIGLLVVEQTRNRRALVAACDGLRREKELRQRAEEQLRILVDSSPAAIVTLNHRAEVLAANRAATELLGDSSAGALLGRGIAEQVPLFAQALAVGDSTRPLRASASSWARRATGSRNRSRWR